MAIATLKEGPMATVIGLFEDRFEKKKSPNTVVRPGNQSEDLPILMILLKFALIRKKGVNFIILLPTKNLYYITSCKDI